MRALTGVHSVLQRFSSDKADVAVEQHLFLPAGPDFQPRVGSSLVASGPQKMLFHVGLLLWNAILTLALWNS